MFNPAYPIGNLHPSPSNPHQSDAAAFADLCRSITQIGMVKPLIVAPDQTIMAGHQRMKALLATGATTAPVYLLDQIIPSYQVWDGETIVAEKPAGRAWRRDQDEAIALAKDAPRDTSNLVALPSASYHAVINNVLRGARSTPALPAGLALRSKAEIELSTLVAEQLRRENPSRSFADIQTEANQYAATHASQRTLADALVQQRVRQNDAEQDEDDAAREAEHYG